MDWKQRDSGGSIRKVVEYNTHLTADELLNPNENPYLYGLDDCVKTILENKEKRTIIVGDYDCDGITASSILYLALKELGMDVYVRIPRRFSEGYGLSMKIIDEIGSDTELLITVDNGIAASSQCEAAKKKGLTVVITDHHLPAVDENGENIIPKADAILAPKAVGDSEYKDYCGAALAYRVAEKLIPGNELLPKLLSLAGIGTVADVVPLIGANRALVVKSLDNVNKHKVTAGLDALLKEMKALPADEGDYGFKLGPAMNAAGRLLDEGPMKVFNLLTYDEEPEWFDEEDDEALDMAKELVTLNEERKSLVRSSLELAESILEDTNAPIILYHPSFHEGIVGIIAGELAERYGVPAIVLTDSKNKGILKGSARTAGDLNLKNLLDSVSDLMAGYGGHAGAAGLSVQRENLERLTGTLKEKLKGFKSLQDVMYYDIALQEADVPKALDELKKYAPYGEGNPAPVFLIEGFVLAPKGGKFTRLMGKHNEHVKFLGTSLDATAFYMADRYKEEGSPVRMDIICTLGENYFKGKVTPEAEVLDFKGTGTDAGDDLESLLFF